MFSNILTAALAASLVSPASAFIRFGCNNNLVEERADPILDPGAVSGHAHKIVGGSGFDFTMDYADARASKCSSCPIKEDLSNYWTPKLYYQYGNGSFQSVPTVGDSMADLNGGQTVYYLQRGPAADTKTLKAFPEGFRMLAGDSTKRSSDGTFATDAISFACLGSNQAETNAMPNYNCPSGLRAQVFFPSCWDGKNLDSADHKSHMAYPASGAYNNGPCPASHPVQMISLFFEILYDTNQFASMWHGDTHPFVFANGDPTGYGLHGDFVNGWDVPTLQKVVDDCDDLSAQGVLSSCSAITTFTADEQTACRVPPKINEQVAGFLPALPGCNPVFAGPGAAPKGSCPTAKAATIGAGPVEYTDVTSKGWEYVGCGTDSGDPRTLTGSTSIYSSGVADTMTVEVCLEFCKGYTYMGLEYGSQCFCGNSLAADRAPQAGIAGSCNMKCAGNTDEYCGGPNALSIYKTCSGDCQNAGASSDTSSAVASAVSSTAASSVVSAVAKPVLSTKSTTSNVASSVVVAAVDTSKKTTPATSTTSTKAAVVVKSTPPATNDAIYGTTTTAVAKAVVTSSVKAAAVVTVTAPATTITIAEVTVTKTHYKTKSCAAYKA